VGSAWLLLLLLLLVVVVVVLVACPVGDGGEGSNAGAWCCIEPLGIGDDVIKVVGLRACTLITLSRHCLQTFK
jgi:hypothetical protein